jgi:hypothetical protein
VVVQVASLLHSLLLLAGGFTWLVLGCGGCCLGLLELLVELGVEHGVRLRVVESWGGALWGSWFLIVHRSSKKVYSLVEEVNVAEGFEVNDTLGDATESRGLLHFS